MLWVASALITFSCSQDDSYVPVEEPVLESPVNFDISNVPFQTLSEYNFYEGNMADLNPVYGVVPYALINPLFSDYAKKKRFIWMPSDVSATYQSDYEVLDFPEGTVLIKNFYYENMLPDGNSKVLETRLMINKPEGWIFANYVWNEDQTEATFDLNGSFQAFEWVQSGVTKSVNYRIPAGPECHTCHKIGEVPFPIGPKPRNLNTDFGYSEGVMNQLEKLVDMGYLEDNLPGVIDRAVRWNDPSASLNERVRSYVDVNCAHCHQEEAHCAYRPIRFDYLSTADPVNLGICVEPDNDLGAGLTHIVSPANLLRSVMYYRLNSTDEAVRMPLLGRTLLHDEGVNLIEQWISNLESECY